MDSKIRQLANEIVKRLAAEGKVLEGGWQALVIVAELDKVSETQKREMRKAYFAGAQHLFSSMMNIMDEDNEPTEADLKRMDQIHQELEQFVKESSYMRDTRQ